MIDANGRKQCVLQFLLNFKEVLSKGESLDSILVTAFCTVREASKRVLGLGFLSVGSRKYEVHRSGIGKTLSAGLRVVWMSADRGRFLAYS